ncbi:MAG: cell division protein FtsL [Burkholderiales bacterium]
MTRVNLPLVVVLAALSLAPGHQARRLFIELERAQAQARGYETEYGQLQLEQSTWHAGARREDRARAAADAAAHVRAHRDRRHAGRGRGGEGQVKPTPRYAGARARRERGAQPAGAARDPAWRALALLFAGLIGRSLYLQWIDNSSPAVAGHRAPLARARGARAPGPHRRPPGRGARGVHAGEGALWAFPDKFEATTEQMAALARLLETTPAKLQASPTRTRTSRSSRSRWLESWSARWRCASRASTTRTNTAADLAAR